MQLAVSRNGIGLRCVKLSVCSASQLWSAWDGADLQHTYAGWWFGTSFFSISWECHHPNWRTHIFQRGGSTTKQYLKDVFLATPFHSATPNTSTYLGMDQYLLIPFLVGWTSIYQLFWCSPGVQGFDTLPFQHWRFPQSISIDKRTVRTTTYRETGRQSSSRQSGGQRRLSVNPKQCDPPTPDRYGGTPSYPFIDGFSMIFHYKPSSYWGTPIYGNLHTAHIAKYWWFSEPLGIQVQHFWKGIR